MTRGSYLYLVLVIRSPEELTRDDYSTTDGGGIDRGGGAPPTAQGLLALPSPMGLPSGEHIGRDPEEKRRQRRGGGRRFRPVWLLCFFFWIAVVSDALLPSSSCPRPCHFQLGGSWPASANWTGGGEGQGEGRVASSFLSSPPLSLIDVRRPAIQKLESNLKHADACMQAHRSPSDGGKVD